MRHTRLWQKLHPQDAACEFDLTTYEGEVILVDESCEDLYNKFYFNAQEHFSKEQLNQMDWWIK